MNHQTPESLDGQTVLANLLAQLPTDALPDKIWVACSGGLDSSVLLFILDMWQRSQPEFELAVLHVNYALRGAESDRDEAMVREQAQKYGRELRVLKVDPRQHPPQKSGVQEWARTVRYDWFAQQRGARDWIAVAHHQDDWVETIFARLCRGHSLLAVSGMQVLHAGIWRPLLGLTRAQIKALADRYQVGFVEDSSNQSLDYTRNRLRQRILPELEGLFPGLRQNLLVHARDLEDCLQAVQKQHAPLVIGESLAFADIKDRPPFLARHEISRFLQTHGPAFRLSREQLFTIHKALEEGLTVNSMLAPGSKAICHKGILRLEMSKEPHNARWQQYQAALLDESPEVWPPDL